MYVHAQPWMPLLRPPAWRATLPRLLQHVFAVCHGLLGGCAPREPVVRSGDTLLDQTAKGPSRNTNNSLELPFRDGVGRLTWLRLKTDGVSRQSGPESVHVACVSQPATIGNGSVHTKGFR